jgi:hypothetical protein
VLIGAEGYRSDGLHIELPAQSPVDSSTGKVAKRWIRYVPLWVDRRSITGFAVICLIATGMFWAGRRSAKRVDRKSDWEVAGQDVRLSPSPAPATSPERPVVLGPDEVDDSPASRYTAKPFAPGQPPIGNKSEDIFDGVAAAQKQAAGHSVPKVLPPSPSGSKTPLDSSNAAGLGAACAGIGCNGPPVSSTPRHVTGDHLSPTSGPVGRGALTLICGTDRDSVVLLVDAQSLELIQSAYVRAHDTVELKGIAPGTYWVRVTQGNMWDDTDGRFYRDPSYFQFPHPYKFAETDVGKAIESDHVSLTLNEVPDGNVRIVHITPVDFWPHGRPVHVKQ